jgi:hypothetical protein
MKRSIVVAIVGLASALGCLTDDPANNDGNWVMPPYLPVTGDGDGTTPAPGDGDPTVPGDGDGLFPGDGDGTFPGDGDGLFPGDGDGVLPGDGDGDNTGPSAREQIAGTGTANNCSTYGLPNGGNCGGIYCAIDEDLLSRALSETPSFPNGCGAVPADLICSGITARTVAACARKEKSAAPLAPNSELRPKIQTCVLQEAEIAAKMPTSCLSCYLDSAECSGDNCLIDCLGGDSPTCDKCRLDKGCSRPVADCTGFPNPL